MPVEAPDLDVSLAQRRSGATENSFAVFTSTRAVSASADASFAFGARASRPTSGALGDRYFTNNIGSRGGWLYYWTGTAWAIVAGWASGTDAARSAITPTSSDNGAWFYTSDTSKFWEVSGGAWVDRTPALSTEAVQDIVGAMASDSASIDLAYDDGAGTLTAALTAQAWQAWTPTWTNLSVGDGTVSAKYVQIGKSVFCRLSIVLGASSTITGTIQFSLPVTSTSYDGSLNCTPIGMAGLVDAGTRVYQGLIMWQSTTLANIVAQDSSATYLSSTNTGTSIPFAWGSGDEINCEFFYEAA